MAKKLSELATIAVNVSPNLKLPVYNPDASTAVDKNKLVTVSDIATTAAALNDNELSNHDGRLITLEQALDIPVYGVKPTNPLKNNEVTASGDSVMAGQGSSTQAKAFINKIGAYLGGTVKNFAEPGKTVRHQLPIIMGHGDLAQPSAKPVYTYHPTRNGLAVWCVGVNDIRYGEDGGIVPGAETFLCEAFTQEPVPATNSAVVKTGTWAASTIAGANNATRYVGLTSYTKGDYIEWTFTGNHAYVNILLQAANSGIDVLAACKIYVDGVQIATRYVSGEGPFIAGYAQGVFGAAGGLYPVAVPFLNLANGSHTIRIEHFGANGYSDARPFIISHFGVLESPNDTAPALVGAIYPFDAYQNGNILQVRAAEAKNAELKAMVNTFQSIGLRCQFIEYTTYVPGNSVDGLHPNDVGHNQIFLDYISSPFLV